MILLPELWWPGTLLALALFTDAVMSLRAPRFIHDCLDGVGFPRDWWWTLIVIKLLATAGLLIGLAVPGIGLAANIGIVAYFLAAVCAHIRARFLKQEFWLNCLGMLILSMPPWSCPTLLGDEGTTPRSDRSNPGQRGSPIGLLPSVGLRLSCRL